MNNLRKSIINCFIPGIVTLAVLCCLYSAKGYAPFGHLSLATDDCNLQYLDFLSYLQDALKGSNSIFYSFSKVLGGNTIGIVSYYLASPFNLLVLLFPKAELVSFVDIVIALKLAAAAITCAVFLNYRFKHLKESRIYHSVITCILAVSYASGQYSIAQSSNIMWLDGVYMLPLILLGVFKLVRERKCAFLSISVGLSIIFNWYTGGINCLFAIIWFFFELITNNTDQVIGNSFLKTVKANLGSIVHFGLAMSIGVLLSGILFFPTVAAMHNSAEGALEFLSLYDSKLLGNPLSLIDSYLPGVKSTQSSVSLYCGFIPILGFFGFFLSRNIRIKTKISYLALTILVVLSLYWNPLYLVFSLFKPAYSYWCRFSYIGIMTLVYVAASFYLNSDQKDLKRTLLLSAILFLAVLLYRLYSDEPGKVSKAVFPCLFLLGITVLVMIFNALAEKDPVSVSSSKTKICLLALLAVFIAETGYGVGLQMDNYHSDNADSFRQYTKEKEAQIKALKNHDPGFYRVSDISIRDDRDNGLAAAYNEAMAYNYWSVSGYTSVPDASTSLFLDRLGYRSGDPDMNITNTSILASDSLLGVKYILSKDPINGLVPLDAGTAESGKKIFQNPFTLPMAMTYDEKSGDRSSVHNNFDYIDYLYTLLYGEKTNLFVRLDYVCSVDEKGDLLYDIHIPEGNFAVYGNMPWEREYNGLLDLNGKDKTAYARWLSPSVFYIPTEQGDSSCYVRLSSGNDISSNGAEQFYALDLNRLKEVTAKLQEKSASVIDIRNGYAHIEAKREGDKYLLISIPYDKGWDVKLNGELVEPELFGDCLYSILLSPGDNVIEMKYCTEYLTLGIMGTLVGVLLLIVQLVLQKRSEDRTKPGRGAYV